MAFVHTAIVLIEEEHQPRALIVRDYESVVAGDIFQRDQIIESRVTASTAMVRRTAYEAAGPYDPSYGLPADGEMWLRLAEGHEVGYVREPQALILSREPAAAVMSVKDEIFGHQKIFGEWASRIYGSRTAVLAAHIRLQKNIQLEILPGYPAGCVISDA